MEVKLGCDDVVILNGDVYIKPDDKQYKDVYNAYKVLEAAEFCRDDYNYAVNVTFSGPHFVIEQVATVFGKQADTSIDGAISCLNIVKFKDVTRYIHDMMKEIYTKPFNEHLRTVCIQIDSACYEAESYHYSNYFIPQYAGQYFGYDDVHSNDRYNVLGVVAIQRTNHAPTVNYNRNKKR